MTISIPDALAAALGADHVRTDDACLGEYSRDLTENPAGRPEVVVFPGSVEDVQAVLAVAREHKRPVVPVMANSNLGGLAIPVRGGIVVSLKRMNRILEVNAEDHFALIEPGVTWQDVSDYLDEHHPELRFAYPLSPPDTGVVPNCLLDGLANLSLRHGSASHWINSLEAVLPSGEILRTGHLAYGSDRPCTSAPFPMLHGLFVSFQGTTGIVTKLAVQLWPRRKFRKRLFLMAYDVDHAYGLVSDLARGDLMDDLGSLSLPTGKMLFGEPKPTYKDPNEPILFVYADLSSDYERDFAFKQEVVCEKVDALRAAGARFDGPLDLDDLVRLEPRFSKFAKFPTRLDFLLDTQGGGLTWIGTYGPTSRFAEGFKRGAEIMAKYGNPPLTVCRPMQGGHFGVLRWITVFDRDDPEEIARTREVNRELCDMAVEMGFFPYKTPQWAWERYGARLDPVFRRLVRQVRHLLDPDGIMNPGHLELPE
jgi:glycolate oxidase